MILHLFNWLREDSCELHMWQRCDSDRKYCYRAYLGFVISRALFEAIQTTINSNISGARRWLLNILRPRQNGRHFQTTFSNGFLERKCVTFDYNFIEVCSYGSYWQYCIIVSDNGLAPSRRHYLNQWCFVYWRIYASLGHNELNFLMCTI